MRVWFWAAGAFLVIFVVGSMEHSPKSSNTAAKTPTTGASEVIPTTTTTSELPPSTTSTLSTTPDVASPPGSWCSATAVPANDGYVGDYNVDVTSNQFFTLATASDATDSYSYETDGSGDSQIFLWHTSPGEAITVSVGSAICYTTAQ